MPQPPGTISIVIVLVGYLKTYYMSIYAGHQYSVTMANVTKATVTRANVTKATVTRANVIKATVTRANVTKATVTIANVTKATVTRANVPCLVQALQCAGRSKVCSQSSYLWCRRIQSSPLSPTPTQRGVQLICQCLQLENIGKG